MILEFVMTGILGAVGTLLAFFLNAVGLGDGAERITGGIVVGYTFLDTFVPVHEVLVAIGVLLSMYVYLFGYRMFREAWSLVPIIGGRS